MATERDEATMPFLLLSALFVAALITCNLIANKWVEVDLGFKVFLVSAGALPYPVTFLVTDLLSELYGKRRANRVVFCGFFASLFVLGVLWLGAKFDATDKSPVSDDVYLAAFQNAPRVIAASMTAYLVAQFVDIRLFHFWKDLTRGRHLWLRNNASTVTSQLLDSALVVIVLFAGTESASWITFAILDLWLFKALCAALDTPIIYAIVHAFRRFAPTSEQLRWAAVRARD